MTLCHVFAVAFVFDFAFVAAGSGSSNQPAFVFGCLNRS
jgi:hypothetical protein